MSKATADFACEDMLVSFLALLKESADQLRHVPQKRQDLKKYVKMIASALNNLGLYHEVLLRRILCGEAILNRDSADPNQRSTILENRKDASEVVSEIPDIQTALDDALESLNSLIGYLDEKSMERLPREDGDVGRFLALCLALEAELAWYLEVDLLGRLWPVKPPPGAFDNC